MNVLCCNIRIGAYRENENNPLPQEPSITVLWDTGAQGSVITASLASELGLVLIGKVEVHGANAVAVRDAYLVNIFLPNRVLFPGVRVTECEKLTGNFRALLGMDIIAAGDFAVTNQEGRTVLSYQVPSIHRIDFADEITKEKERISKKEGAKAVRQAYESAQRRQRRRKKKK